MLPLIAWSLAVYGGAAALVLLAAHRWIERLTRRSALILAAMPLLLTGPATFTAGVYAPIDILYGAEPFTSHPLKPAGPARTPLLSDVVCSMIPWQQAVRDALTHGRLPLWNRFLLAGEPLLATQQPAVLHPATWIGLLLPVPQAWTLQMSLRLLVALLSAFLLLRDLGCREGPGLIGAVAWAFSDFMVFWIGYPVANAIGPFPLLALGLRRLARQTDRRAFGLTTGSLLLIITAGHPEMLLFAVAAGGVWFLFELAHASSGRRFRALLLSLGAGALALGLTAVQLLPLAEALPQTWEAAFRSEWYAHQPKSVDIVQSARRSVLSVVPFAYGVSGKSGLFREFGVPAAYSGALLFPLAWTGLFFRERPRGALVALGCLGAACWARLAVVSDAIGRLPLFSLGVLDYLVFAAIFALAVLAAFGAERLSRGEGRMAFLCGAVASMLLILWLFRWRSAGMAVLGMAPEFARERLAWEIVPLVVAALLVAPAIPGASARVPILLALFLVARFAEVGRLYPTLPASAFYPRLPALDAVPREAPERFVGLGATLLPNAATLYGLEDVRGYESMTFRPLRDTYPLWSRPLAAWFNIVEDLRRPFLSFLNVKYALVPPGEAPPPGWRLRSRGTGADLLENLSALPRAFVPAWLKRVPDAAARLEALNAIADFGERGVIAEAGHSDAWTRNGRATATVASYRPQAMTLSVEAEEDTIVATSVTAWKGWKFRLDGVTVEPLSYNHAFLAVAVPRGRHHVELRYLPDSFRIGMTLSLVSFFAGILVFGRPRRAAA